MRRQDLSKFSMRYLYENQDHFVWSDIETAIYDHVNKYCTTELAGERNVCVVCPYFSEVDDLSGRIKKKGSAVAKNIENMLRNLDRDIFTVVLFDKKQEYLRKTHKLVEEGLIDMTIINPGRIDPGRNLSEKAGFANSKENYKCGMYGSGCVRTVTEGIRWYAPYWSVIPIRDAILYKELPDITAIFESAYGLVKGVTVQDILSDKPLAHRIC